MITARSPSKFSRNRIFLIIIFLFLLIVVCLYFFLNIPSKPENISVQSIDTTSIPTQDIKTPPDTTSIPKPEIKKEQILPKKKKPKVDTLVVIDTSSKIRDTTSIKKVDPCATDTIAPWVYPDPSGGLHYGAVNVRFFSTKPCTILWKRSQEQEWHVYAGDSIQIANTMNISFKASDTCGNQMQERTERYEIQEKLQTIYCPKDMEYVKIDKIAFCIDRYEWPNKKGFLPTTHVSLYQAMDSCYTVQKRLCTSDEWSLACGGVYSWKYPYGSLYEQNACITQDTSMQKAGSKPECRGYFNIFDMSGNVAEWTSTPSPKNSSFYNVLGGFWESGPQSTCFDPRYSYYPQNKHNPVGFRCCKDIR